MQFNFTSPDLSFIDRVQLASAHLLDGVGCPKVRLSRAQTYRPLIFASKSLVFAYDLGTFADSTTAFSSSAARSSYPNRAVDYSSKIARKGFAALSVFASLAIKFQSFSIVSSRYDVSDCSPSFSPKPIAGDAQPRYGDVQLQPVPLYQFLILASLVFPQSSGLPLRVQWQPGHH